MIATDVTGASLVPMKVALRLQSQFGTVALEHLDRRVKIDRPHSSGVCDRLPTVLSRRRASGSRRRRSDGNEKGPDAT
jgi:hypothetical protein